MNGSAITKKPSRVSEPTKSPKRLVMSRVHTLYLLKRRPRERSGLPFLMNFYFLSATGLERQAQSGFLGWVEIKMPIGRRGDFGVVEAR